ncbi:hypothetical protein JW766_06250 [Candidatus Dojkabacteria bacterium]|nr:hypothetical protein [Candidatus Dojkabacteria bacterium]
MQAVKGDEEIVNLQVSEEELEVLLDNVGIPEDGEPEAQSSLRQKLREFLMKIRQGCIDMQNVPVS